MLSRIVRRLVPVLALVLLAPAAATAQSASAGAARRFVQLPEACGYLSADVARGLLRAEPSPGAANEHIPTFSSQCAYSGRGVVGRQVTFVFKFMLDEMFDVASLEPVQLEFNTMFAVSASAPGHRLDLGAASFAFEDSARTTLLVITGIQGPPDGAQRPTGFIATYQLSDPDRTHAQRLDELIAQARRHLEEWLARA